MRPAHPPTESPSSPPARTRRRSGSSPPAGRLRRPDLRSQARLLVHAPSLERARRPTPTVRARAHREGVRRRAMGQRRAVEIGWESYGPRHLGAWWHPLCRSRGGHSALDRFRTDRLLAEDVAMLASIAYPSLHGQEKSVLRNAREESRNRLEVDPRRGCRGNFEPEDFLSSASAASAPALLEPERCQ